MLEGEDVWWVARKLFLAMDVEGVCALFRNGEGDWRRRGLHHGGSGADDEKRSPAMDAVGACVSLRVQGERAQAESVKTQRVQTGRVRTQRVQTERAQADSIQAE